MFSMPCCPGDDFNVGLMLELRLEFRTWELNGIILSVADPRGTSLSLELINGAVSAESIVCRWFFTHFSCLENFSIFKKNSYNKNFSILLSFWPKIFFVLYNSPIYKAISVISCMTQSGLISAQMQPCIR